MEKFPNSIFEKITIEQIHLLEADPERILTNLNNRDKKKYELSHIELLIKEERRAAEAISQRCSCSMHIHQMVFDGADVRKCCGLLNSEVKAE